MVYRWWSLWIRNKEEWSQPTGCRDTGSRSHFWVITQYTIIYNNYHNPVYYHIHQLSYHIILSYTPYLLWQYILLHTPLYFLYHIFGLVFLCMMKIGNFGRQPQRLNWSKVKKISQKKYEVKNENKSNKIMQSNICHGCMWFPFFGSPSFFGSSSFFRSDCGIAQFSLSLFVLFSRCSRNVGFYWLQLRSMQPWEEKWIWDQNEDHLKNGDYPQNEDDLKIRITSKKELISKMQITQKT